MKRQIRQGVFETNSSSTHSLTMCSKEDFDAWRRGELLFDYYGRENFVKVDELSDKNKKVAAKEYEMNKDDFQKDWEDLSEDAKNKYYAEYAKENDLISQSGETYEEYMNDYELATFEETYTTPNGDAVVAFGKYGYN